MRIMTGALAFFASSAGMHIDTAPPPLAPNPPPVYSQTKTTSFGSTPAQLAADGCVRIVLWVDPCRNNLPFCQ